MKNKQKDSSGKFILIEGPDTAGKTTQTQRLKEMLETQGETVELLHFPDYQSPFGELILSYLKGHFNDNTFETFLAIQMAYVADQFAAQRRIQSLLKEGAWVIADRYDLSTLAYSQARYENSEDLLATTRKCLEEKGGVLGFIAQIQGGLIKPDLTFVLDLPYTEIRKRKQDLDMFESDDCYMKSVAEAYTLLAGNPLEQERTIHRLDATQTIDEVHQNIMKVIQDVCEREGKPCN